MDKYKLVIYSLLVLTFVFCVIAIIFTIMNYNNINDVIVSENEKNYNTLNNLIVNF
jgi:hypothetical protein